MESIRPQVQDFAREIKTTLIDPSSSGPSQTFTFRGRECVAWRSGETIEIRTSRQGYADNRCDRTLQGHSYTVSSVAMSPDGQYIVSGSEDRTIKVWSLRTGECVRTLSGSSGNVSSVAVTPDSQYIVSSGLDKDIRIWSMQTGECVRTLHGDSEFGYRVVVSPDGRHIVSCSVDSIFKSSIKVWCVQTGECVRTLYEGHEDVYCVAVSPDDQHVASGSGEDSVKVWSMRTGEHVHRLQWHLDRVYSVAMSPDGQYVVSGSRDRSVKVWSLQNGQCVHTLEGHSKVVSSVCVSPDGQHVLSGSVDCTIKVWSMQTGQCIRTLQGHSKGVTSVIMSPNGHRIVSGSVDWSIKVWSMRGGQCMASFERKDDGPFTLSVAQWHDGTEIGTIEDDGHHHILYVASKFTRSNVGSDHSALCQELLQSGRRTGIVDRIDGTTPLLSILTILDKVDLLRSVLSDVKAQCDGGTIPSEIMDARGGYRVQGSGRAVYERPTALHYALMLGRSQCAQTLLEHGASIDACQTLEMPNSQLLSIAAPVRKHCDQILDEMLSEAR